MRKIILLLLLGPLLANAQTDSSSVKINVNIQARDLEYMAAVLPYSLEYEDVYDAAKAKFRVASPPSGNTNVAIDSVTVGTWLKIALLLQDNTIAVAANVYSRVEAVLRAKNNAWLTGKLNWYIADGTNYYNNLRAIGRKRLRKQ